MQEETIFCKKNSANRSITSALLVAIVCFGRGRWVRGFVEIKIFDHNLTLLKMILKIFFSEILLYLSQYLFGFCVFDSRKHSSPDTFFKREKAAGFHRYLQKILYTITRRQTRMDGFISITFLRSILQKGCCETESKTVYYTATSWFSMVSASCTIDPTET